MFGDINDHSKIVKNMAQEIVREKEKAAILNWAGEAGLFPSDEQVDNLIDSLEEARKQASREIISEAIDGVKQIILDLFDKNKTD